MLKVISAKLETWFGTMLLWLVAWLWGYPSAGFAEDSRLFTTRNHNPFTQVFGLPMYPSVEEVGAGRWSGLLVFDIVNHADSNSSTDESVQLDGETYTVNAIVSFGLNEHWQLGMDVPYVWYRPGTLDGFIENWHDLWGISNGNRTGPRDELFINYTRDNTALFTMDEQNSGIGDVRLWASYQLMDRGEGHTHIMTRATVKLPTGDSDDLHGSGAADLAWDFTVRHTLYQGNTTLDLSANVGLLALGDGDVLADYQEDIVSYGGIGVVWKMSRHLDLLAQIYGQSSYFESDLDEVGGTTFQLTAGFRYQWPDSNVQLLAGLVEDLFSDATPDIAFHFELRKVFQ